MSMLPLVQDKTGITHIILAAIHLNDEPGNITLNDDPPSDRKFNQLWTEVCTIRTSGVKVMGMLGGAAQGSFNRLDGSGDQFKEYYDPLLKMIRDYSLDGLDLDVEEKMSLPGVIRLIDRDLGNNFIVTLAPVADALLNEGNMSRFDYKALEKARGSKANWYNVQFYNGWGSAEDPTMYDQIIHHGWSAHRVILGLLTNPQNGESGFVALKETKDVLRKLTTRHKDFGGVIGWEYFNAMPGGIDNPWEWAKEMTQSLI